MPIHGGRHCGKVQVELPREPDWVAVCKSSLCCRTAWRAAFYPLGAQFIPQPSLSHVIGSRIASLDAMEAQGATSVIGHRETDKADSNIHWTSLY